MRPSVGWWVGHLLDRPVVELFRLLLGLSEGQSVVESVIRWAGQSVGRSVSSWVSQSVSGLISQTVCLSVQFFFFFFSSD